jgi:BON domain
MTPLLNPKPDLKVAADGPHHPTLDHKVGEKLRQSSYRALRGISCTTVDGEVRLMGVLPSYYLKQVAQEITGDVEGVRDVVNLIKVSARRADREAPRSSRRPELQHNNTCTSETHS